MDYLNIPKIRRHHAMLLLGYVLIAVAIITSTWVLVTVAGGIGLSKNGTIVQNGLVFFSSQPHPANIYLNGQLNSKKTNSRLFLPDDIYQVKMSRTGYRDWQRTISVNGNSVEHFDYPFLFPAKLTTKKLQAYTTAPTVMTQSPNRRWLLVQEPGPPLDFDLYDLSNPAKTPADAPLPAGIASSFTGSESWQALAWADDNQHVLLQHSFDGKTEFILFNRSDPAQSVNLTSVLSAGPATISLNNAKYNQYYLYDTAASSLKTASLSNPAPVERLEHVLAFKPYGNDTILYVTGDGATAGNVLVKIASGSKLTTLRSLPAGTTYLVDLTQYSGVTYTAIGAASLNKVYIYRDPASQLANQPKHAIVPVQVLHVEQPNYLSFSTSAQFIVVENGERFGVYDIENKLGYNYTTTVPLDTPQTHATWMDGDRLSYISGGKLQVADYDDANPQTLMPASSNSVPVFSPNFDYVYALAPDSAASGQLALTQTALLTPADQ